MNIILFEDLAKKVQTQLYEPTSLIHVLFIITPHLGFNFDTLVSDFAIYDTISKYTFFLTRTMYIQNV